MAQDILSVAQMTAADSFAVGHGVASLDLMEHAGRAVADAIAARWTPCKISVLCGPGNNGGDGYVAARFLVERGFDVWVETLVDRAALKGDAAAMAARWTGKTMTLAENNPEADIYIDALFGAGLSRALEGQARRIAELSVHNADRFIAVDVPSGLSGDTGKALGGVAVHAALTVTFFCKKPGHVLFPGRAMCGAVEVADIGIPLAALDAIKPQMFENGPAVWGAQFPRTHMMGHKYTRGHCVVVSGPAHATGAARLAAMAALRGGAGLVSVASPRDAVPINAAHLTAIMIKPLAGADSLAKLLEDARLNAVVIGPGVGVGPATQNMVGDVLSSKAGAVLDADALTSFAGAPSDLFAQLREPAVLTPHAGEFAKLFPGLLERSKSKIDAAREAAACAGCTVLLKGADTVIANPRGDVIVNTNAPPTLATAGAGDVLAGIIGAHLAQGMGSFHEAAAAVWLHGAAATLFGQGLIAEDLPELLPAALTALRDDIG
jgi:NAD(P)H-hydrate epimerase